MARESARAVGGEVSTHALTELPGSEWHLFHDVRWPGRPRASIDHVAIGPQGVFVIDDLAWSGEITVTEGVLRQDGRRRTKFVDGATKASEAVGVLLQGLAPEAVLPVLCVVRPEPVFGWAGAVMVCSTDNLVRMVAARPRLLDEKAVTHAGKVLSAILEPATAPALPAAPLSPPPAPPAETALAAPRPRRRRTSSEGLVRRCIAVGILVVAVSTLMRLDVLPPLSEMRERGAARINDLRHPASPAGTTLTLEQTPTRPSLDFTAGSPAATRSTTASVRALPGNELLAVQLTARNGGGTVWTSFPDTTVLLRDTRGRTFRTNPTVTSVGAGRVLPAAIRLAPGRSTRGLMVFEVPRGTTIATVELVMGPGKPDVLRWRSD